MSPASADQPTEWSSSADNIWDVVNADTNVRHTGAVRALVRDLVEYNGHMYVAGKFLDVQSPAGLTFSQPYLARFDVDTGEWDSSYTPTVDAIIYAIEITSDGRLFAAGELSGGVALYDTNTGLRDTTFDPKFKNSWGPPAVFDIEVVGNELYAGGTFVKVGDQIVRDLARVDATTGQVDSSWIPKTNMDVVTPRMGGHNIFGLAVDAARGRVYVAGKFGGINNDSTASYFATINTSDGELSTSVPQGLPANIPNHRDSFSMWMMDVQWRGDSVYVGGQGHQTMILDVDTMLPRHTFFANRGVGNRYGGGDTQVIFLADDTIWSGCHCWGSVGEYQLGSYNAEPDGHQTFTEYKQWRDDFRLVNPFGQQPIGGGYGVDIDTEELLPLSFDVKGQAGAYAVFEDSNGRVWFGGEYSKDVASGRSLSGIARFSPIDGDAGPSGLRTTKQTQERVVLTWDALPGAVSYNIVRDGVEVGSKTTRWFTDQAVSAGTAYAYQVQGVFNDGSLSGLSAVVNATTKGTQPPASQPVGLRSTKQTQDRIVLTWDALPGAVSYNIVRDGVEVGSKTTRWFTDQAVSPATTYGYQVQGVFADGSLSVVSATVEATTAGAAGPMAQPTGLRASLQTRERIVLTWDLLEGATGYIILRDGVEVGTKTGRWFTDSGLAADTSFDYQVQGVGADGTLSAVSEIVSLATLP